MTILLPPDLHPSRLQNAPRVSSLLHTLPRLGRPAAVVGEEQEETEAGEVVLEEELARGEGAVRPRTLR